MAETSTNESDAEAEPILLPAGVSRDELSEFREWLFVQMADHIDLEDLSSQTNPWSSKSHIRQNIKFGEYDYEPIEREIHKLHDEGLVIYWHGWCAPVNREVLRTIIRAEKESDVTRQLLIGKCNKAMQTIPEMEADG